MTLDRREYDKVRLDELDKRLNKIEARMNYLFGALGVLVVLGNVSIAVVIANAVK